MTSNKTLQKNVCFSFVRASLSKRGLLLFCFLAIVNLVAYPQALFAKLSDEEEQHLHNLATQMTLEELIGQTLMLGYHAQVQKDLATKSNEGIERLIKKYRLGSVIVFKRNIPWSKNEKSRRQAIWKLTDSFQDVAFDSQPASRKVPLLIAIDQEGGGKMEIKEGVTRIPDSMYIGATRSPDLAMAAGKIIGSELKMLGLNTVLGPVADINNNDRKDVVGKRSFGAHKDLVAAMAVCFMQGLQKTGVLSICKHYPGHGDADQDPHLHMPEVSYATVSQLRNWDQYPFRKLIEFGVDGIMTAHLIVPPLDNKPITISSKAISELRKEYKFDGIVVSDDIANMMGILEYVGPSKDVPDRELNQHFNLQRIEVMRRALEAGTDIVMMASIERIDNKEKPERTVTEEEFDFIYQKLLEYFSSEDKNALLRQSVKRILRQKARLVKLNAFQQRSAWQPNLDEEAFQKLRQRHAETTKTMALNAVILITDKGKFVNNPTDSTLFAKDVGPLSENRLLMTTDDRLLIVSPVFKDDTLTRHVKNHPRLWFPKSNIKTELLIYGWRKYGLEDAAKHWNLPEVKRYFYQDHSGKLIFLEDNIMKKVDQLVFAAENVNAVLFGLVTEAQVKILDLFLKKVKNTPVVVLLSKEPYFLSANIYERKNVSVLFSPTLPDEEIAVNALFGVVQPKTIRNLPFNIPPKVNVKLDNEIYLEPESNCQLKQYEDYYQNALKGYREAERLKNANKKDEAIKVFQLALRSAEQSVKFASPDQRQEVQGLFEKIDELLLSLLPIVE